MTYLKYVHTNSLLVDYPTEQKFKNPVKGIINAKFNTAILTNRLLYYLSNDIWIKKNQKIQ